MIQWILAIWSLVLLPFINPAFVSGSSQFMYCWSPAWRILNITLLACEKSTTLWQFEHSLAWPFFGIGMKTELFQFCGHCWVFQICWQVECATFTASSFRIWNSSAGIPSPPLALFVVMLPKAYLTSHSRLSDPRWVTASLWLFRSFKPCFVKFCISLPPLLNLFCFDKIPAISILYWAHLYTKCSFGVSNFLEVISSLSHSVVTSYIAFLISCMYFLSNLYYFLPSGCIFSVLFWCGMRVESFVIWHGLNFI